MDRNMGKYFVSDFYENQHVEHKLEGEEHDVGYDVGDGLGVGHVSDGEIDGGININWININQNSWYTALVILLIILLIFMVCNTAYMYQIILKLQNMIDYHIIDEVA